MPVFHRLQDKTLVVTIDGDFTPGELERAVGRALDSEGLPTQVGVLLDLSGVANSHGMGILEMAHVFVAHPTEVLRIAVLGSVTSTATDGLEVRAFQSKAEALDWLNA